MAGRVRDQRGAALVELAIALPMLIVVLLGTVDFGRVFRSTMVVTNAARAGALYGAQDPSLAADTTGMIAAANAVLTANALTTGPAPTASTLCQCATDAGVFTPTSPVNSCTATCTGGHITTSVTVSVTRTFSMLASFPGLPNTVTFTRVATGRAK
jgi:Flp pilus assembly protein TadG